MVINKRQHQILLFFWINQMAISFIIPDHGLDVINVEVDYSVLDNLFFNANPNRVGEKKIRSSFRASISVLFASCFSFDKAITYAESSSLDAECR